MIDRSKTDHVTTSKEQPSPNRFRACHRTAGRQRPTRKTPKTPRRRFMCLPKPAFTTLVGKAVRLFPTPKPTTSGLPSSPSSVDS